MNTLEIIKNSMQFWGEPRQQDGMYRVRTHCLYPSNAVVDVYIQGGQRSFIVHDGGGAFDELSSSAGTVRNPERIVRASASSYGLKVTENGTITASDIKPAELAGAIVLTANASRDAAASLLSHIRAKRRNLKMDLEKLLSIEFPHLWQKEAKVSGESNKLYRFDYAIRLKNNQSLLLDLVVPDASSINAAVVKHLDVSRTKERKFEQRIIYDDMVEWKSSDLSLLSVGSKTVPFSQIERTLERLAA